MNFLDALIGFLGRPQQGEGASEGSSTPPVPPTPSPAPAPAPGQSGTTSTDNGGTMGQTGSIGCAPAYHALGDNSAWFVYHGIEVGLVVLMLIGILAVLFGNPETDLNIAEVAAV